MQPEPKIFPFSRPPSPQNLSANGNRSFSFFVTCAACGTLSDADHGTIISVVEHPRSAPAPSTQSGELSGLGEMSGHAASAMGPETTSDDEFPSDVVSMTIPVRTHLRCEPIGDFLDRKHSNGNPEGETWAKMWRASPRKARFLDSLRALDAIPAFLYRAWCVLANRGKVPFFSQTIYGNEDADALLEFFAKIHIPIFGNVAVSQDRPSKHEGDPFSGTTFFTGVASDMEQDDESVGRVAFFPEWRVRVFGFRKIGMLFRCLFREVMDMELDIYAEFDARGNIGEVAANVSPAD